MPNGTDTYKVNNYAAAFIDLLGQRAALRGCGLLPDTREEFLPIARETIGVVQWLHTAFEQFYTELKKEAGPSESHKRQR